MGERDGGAWEAQVWEFRGRRRRRLWWKAIQNSLRREVTKEMKSQEGVVWEGHDQLLDKIREWQGNALRLREKWGENWEVEGLSQEVLRGIQGWGPAVCIAHKHPRWCGHTLKVWNLPGLVKNWSLHSHRAAWGKVGPLPFIRYVTWG